MAMPPLLLLEEEEEEETGETTEARPLVTETDEINGCCKAFLAEIRREGS
jgi:hypothetical protein